MNASKSYHKNPSGRNSQFSLYTLSNNDLGVERQRTRGERDYTNEAYRLYWAEHVSAMVDLTACASKVLAQIIRDQRQKGYCTRSVANLGAKCACSPRTVARALAAMSRDETIRVYQWYRPGRRGRTASHIYINWEHDRWRGCAARGVAAGPTDDGQLGEDLTAILAEDSLRENSRELATAVSMTAQETAPAETTATEKTQAEKVEAPEPAPEAVQRVVLETLLDLGVPPVIAISDARRAPAQAFVVLAVVYSILKRGGIRNPAGLARAALRDPARYLPNRARAAPECVPRARPAAELLCLHCREPIDPQEVCVLLGDGRALHWACDEASRG